MVRLQHIRIFAIGLGLILWLSSFAVMAAEIEVRTDRNPVGLNESFQLIYETEGDLDDDPDFSPLEKQLDILNRSQSSNISIINGRYSSKKTWTLTAMAKTKGELELPPVSFGSDKSPTFTLQVNEASQDSAQKDNFFTRVRISQAQVSVQQQLIITQQLFSAYNLSAYGLGELEFEGVEVVVEPLGDEKQYRTRIEEQSFVVVEKQFAVFPQQSGSLLIQPVLAEGQLGSGSNSLFNPFGNRGKVVRARSDQVKIDVLPTPTGVDVNPWLPASNLELVEQWQQDPPQFIQGEPLTRTLSIKADGLTDVQLPELPEVSIEDLKQYPDQPLLKNVRNDTGLTGYRVEKVAYIPTKPGQITLPAIEIAWWNTKTQKREVARIDARVIQVAPAPATTEPSGQIEQNSQPQETIAVTPETEKQVEVEIEKTTNPIWMWVAVCAILGWLATVVGWFLYSQRTVTESPVKQSSSDAVQQKIAFKQLMVDCKQGDVRACRADIMQWAKLYFAANNIKSLADLDTLLPKDIMRQLKNLDAGLYGSGDANVDLVVLGQRLKQFVKQDRQTSDRSSETLLQPLYK